MLIENENNTRLILSQSSDYVHRTKIKYIFCRSRQNSRTEYDLLHHCMLHYCRMSTSSPLMDGVTNKVIEGLFGTIMTYM